MANLNEVYSARRGAAVTKSDTTILEPTRALFVGGAGDLAVRFSDDRATTVTLTGVVAGSVLALSVVQVMNATTATNITALY